MTATAKPNPLIELLITLIIPSLILMKFSDPEDQRDQQFDQRVGFGGGGHGGVVCIGVLTTGFFSPIQPVMPSRTL